MKLGKVISKKSDYWRCRHQLLTLQTEIEVAWWVSGWCPVTCKGTSCPVPQNWLLKQANLRKISLGLIFLNRKKSYKKHFFIEANLTKSKDTAGKRMLVVFQRCLPFFLPCLKKKVTNIFIAWKRPKTSENVRKRISHRRRRWWMNTKKCWRVYPKGAPQQSIHVRSIAGYWNTRRSMLTTTSHGHLGPPLIGTCFL